MNAAVPYLLDLLRIPADTFQLFIATGVINAHTGTLVAAMHTVAVAVLGSAAMVGAIRFQPARLIRYLVVTALATAATLGGLKAAFATILRPSQLGAGLVEGMEPLYPHRPARVIENSRRPIRRGHADLARRGHPGPGGPPGRLPARDPGLQLHQQQG